jgi:hypothetical protein
MVGTPAVGDVRIRPGAVAWNQRRQDIHERDRAQQLAARRIEQEVAGRQVTRPDPGQ